MNRPYVGLCILATRSRLHVSSAPAAPHMEFRDEANNPLDARRVDFRSGLRDLPPQL